MYKYFFKFFIFFLFLLFFLKFNQNNVSENQNIQYIFPAKYIKITSQFGYRNFTGYKKHFHNGIDMANKENTPVFAIADGIVNFAKFNGAYGYTIILSHNDNIKSMYSHLSKNFNVITGQFVKQGELIGYIGPKNLNNDTNYYLFQGEKRNGMTTGPHLHFSIIEKGKFVDPFNFIKKDSA